MTRIDSRCEHGAAAIEIDILPFPPIVPESNLPHVVVVLASTRQGRFGETVARWLMPIIEAREDLTAELVDLRDWKLPYYDQPKVPMAGEYEKDVLPWAQVVGRGDGFVIVTPEYNYGYPAVLKSSLDAVYAEWNRKPVAFVSYGGWGAGVRAVEQLRQVVVELQMASTRGGVNLQFARRLFDEDGNLHDPEFYGGAATRMLDELVWWAAALKAARQ
jgi:NAD(P)H-dependent FMN reductase